MSDPATLTDATPAGADPVTYTATLPFKRSTVQTVGARLLRQRMLLGTRRGRRALSPFTQAVFFLRWLIDATRVDSLAVDFAISSSSAYRYLHEALDVVAADSPSLRGALLAARAAGHAHVMIDGTLIETDRVAIPGPTSRKKKSGETSSTKVDLWWSGKHHCHGGNIQVITAPDGWPIWTSPVRPGREHDTTCARIHPDLLAALAAWTDAEHAVLAVSTPAEI